MFVRRSDGILPSTSLMPFKSACFQARNFKFSQVQAKTTSLAEDSGLDAFFSRERHDSSKTSFRCSTSSEPSRNYRAKMSFTINL